MSNEICRRTMTALVEAVGPQSDRELDEEATAHAASCPQCGAAALRVRETVDGLDAWTVPEPADDLVDRTLERALASLAAGPIDPLAEELEPAAVTPAPATVAAAPEPTEPDRPDGYVPVARPSELLTRRFGTGERPAATVDSSPIRTVVLRVLSQVIAASFIFILSGAFTVYFYPCLLYTSDAADE